jgi:NAD(P)-dependent dehydrogenase (short-subunit alcohol dehydrogenase family)
LIALGLAQAGAAVAILARNEEKNQRVIGESEHSLFGSERIPSYCASKGALVQLTKAMAI